jgi:hypothetical protein
MPDQDLQEVILHASMSDQETNVPVVGPLLVQSDRAMNDKRQYVRLPEGVARMPRAPVP